jgi:hypothetical protein
LSSWNSSEARTRRRVRCALAATVVVLAGCGGTDAGKADPGGGTGSPEQSSPAPRDGTSRAPLSPGPQVPAGAQVKVDELVITDDGDPESLRTEVAAAGGELVSSDQRIGVHVARFPVASVDELLEVRDLLRERGVDAAVNPVIGDPTAGG